MSAASDLTQASWQAFSRLLDEALELPPTERLAWLDALGPEHDGVKPALRAVLARAGGVETAQWLATLPRDAAPPPVDESDLQPGALVGPYRLTRELGVGGMGAVWLAERADGTLKRQVALKLPRASWGRGLAERMARERDILAALEHPNIARLYDAGTDAQGRPYLALEYVEGQPIDAYCRDRSLSINQRLDLLLQVAQAVAFAHSRLVVHRDLKPSNVLVTADGHVRLLDFGIAKLVEGERAVETQLTQIAGRALTLDYASPEQIRGEPIGTASDVYSLGVVSYEILAGARPYKLRRGTSAELEQAIALIDAPLASTTATDASAKRALKGDLDAILNKALKKNPSERYASVDALAQDIERHLRSEPVHAQPDSVGYRVRKFAGRNRVAVTATSAVVIAVLTGATVTAWQARVATAQAKKAEEVTNFLLDLVHGTDPDRGSRRDTTTVEMLMGARARINERFALDPDVQVRLLSAVGFSLLGLGQTDASIPLFEEAIEVARARLSADHREGLLAQSRLGEALNTASRPQEAKAALTAALEGMRRIDDVTGTIDTLRRLSRSHSALRESDAAVAYAEEAVKLARVRLRADQALTLLYAEQDLLTALQVARRRGQLEPARNAYALTERLYPDRLVRAKVVAREFYGTALVAEGNPSEGVPLLRTALEEAKTLFGPRDRMVGYFAGRLMRGQFVVGDVQEALESARFARKTWDTVHGEKLHGDLAFGRLYEGSMLAAVQRFDEAARELTDAAELFARLYGPNHRLPAMARAGAAVARARSGELAGAESLVAGSPPAAIAAYEDMLITSRLGMLRQLQGRPSEAEKALRVALDYLQAQSGDRFDLAGIQASLASVLVDLDRAAEAKSLVGSALELYAELQPASSPAQAEAWETLARAELAIGNVQSARQAASHAVDYWQRLDPACAAAVRARLLDAQAAYRLGDRAAAAMSYRTALVNERALRLSRDRELLNQTLRQLGPDFTRF